MAHKSANTVTKFAGRSSISCARTNPSTSSSPAIPPRLRCGGAALSPRHLSISGVIEREPREGHRSAGAIESLDRRDRHRSHGLRSKALPPAKSIAGDITAGGCSVPRRCSSRYRRRRERATLVRTWRGSNTIPLLGERKMMLLIGCPHILCSKGFARSVGKRTGD